MNAIARVLGTLLCTAALLADFLATQPPDQQDLERFFAPPTRIHFVDDRGSLHWRPFIRRYEMVSALDVVYREKRDSVHPLRFLAPGFAYRVLGMIPANRHLVSADGEPLHLLGTDELGRDVLARILAGARTSLLVVALGFAAYLAIGLAVGSAAGLLGGWIDAVLMRFSEFVLAIPSLYLVLALRALLPVKLNFWQALLAMVGTIAAVTWPPLARGVRGLVLQLRSAVYVEAARALGCSRWRILRTHIAPAISSFALTQAAVAAPVFLLGEVILSFLDVGFRDSGPSWGMMLRNLRDPRVLTEFWWNLAPLVLVFVTLLCLNILGGRVRSHDPVALRRHGAAF